MTRRDRRSTDNVIALGHVVPNAIADQLREMYAADVAADLPDDIAALMQRFREKTEQEAEAQGPAKPPKSETEEV